MKRNNGYLLKGIALPLLFVFAYGCNGTNSAHEEKTEQMAEADSAITLSNPAATNDPLAMKDPKTPQLGTTPQTTSSSSGPDVDPVPGGTLLVKESSMHLSVDDISKAANRLRHWVSGSGGYVTDWIREQHGDQLTLTLTAKVPVSNYESLVDSAESVGLLQAENASATDLMDTLYAAMEARALQHRLGQQYDQLSKRLHKGEDVLSAQEQSASLQEGAEAAYMTMVQMRRKAAMGTIHLELSQPHTVPEAGPGYVAKLWGNFSGGLRDLGNLMLFLVGVWPWLMLLGLGLIALRLVRSNTSKLPMKPN